MLSLKFRLAMTEILSREDKSNNQINITTDQNIRFVSTCKINHDLMYILSYYNFATITNNVFFLIKY